MKHRIRKIFVSLIYWDYSLLTAVFFLIFIIPFFPSELHTRLYDIAITLIYIFAALSVGRVKKYVIPLAILVVVFEWLSSLFGLELINSISRLFTILFFILIVVNFIIGIARAKIVDANVILDAINGYLLLSIVFSILIVVVMRFDPEAFSFPEQTPGIAGTKDEFVDYIYYSLVSITTLGYGDIVPKAPYAKSLATLISVTGQFYVAILVAMLVGKYASRNGSSKNE